MKVQQQNGIDGNTFVYTTMLEGIIQHIVYKATEYNNHSDCPYTSKIYSVGITVEDPPCSVFIMDEIRGVIQGETLCDVLINGRGA